MFAYNRAACRFWTELRIWVQKGYTYDTEFYYELKYITDIVVKLNYIKTDALILCVIIGYFVIITILKQFTVKVMLIFKYRLRTMKITHNCINWGDESRNIILH